MNFFTSKTGKTITGKSEDAFAPDFILIPDGTTAKSSIKSFDLITKVNTYTGQEEKYYQITWKLTEGEFKNREVTQKIKAFDGKPEAIDRALNMMMLVLNLCQCKLHHQDEPGERDLMPCINKILGIKIREWHMEREDGTMMDGNFVSEVHPAQGFVCESGVKLVVEKQIKQPTAAIESAFSRNAVATANLDDDIMF